MTAIDTAFALVIAVLTVVALSLIGVIFVGAARIAVHGDEDGMCAPSRRANITANQSHAERRIALLGLIDAVPLAQLQPQAQPAGDYAVPTPDAVDAIKAGSVTYDLAALTAPATPELPPVAPVVEPAAVPVEIPAEEPGIPVDWPTQVVQPVPLRSR